MPGLERALWRCLNATRCPKVCSPTSIKTRVLKRGKPWQAKSKNSSRVGEYSNARKRISRLLVEGFSMSLRVLRDISLYVSYSPKEEWKEVFCKKSIYKWLKSNVFSTWILQSIKESTSREVEFSVISVNAHFSWTLNIFKILILG